MDDVFDRGVLGEGATMQDINSNNSPSPIPPLLTPQNLHPLTPLPRKVIPCSACAMLANTARFEKLLDDLPKHVASVNGLNRNLYKSIPELVGE